MLRQGVKFPHHLHPLSSKDTPAVDQALVTTYDISVISYKKSIALLVPSKNTKKEMEMPQIQSHPAKKAFCNCCPGSCKTQVANLQNGHWPCMDLAGGTQVVSRVICE
jgi:hypothetical protein